MSDTYFNTSNYNKQYNILDNYYKITYTPSNLSSNYTITTRLLSTTMTLENNSLNSFNNVTENTIDAFGKLRVTEPYTLLDIKFPGQSSGNTSFLQNNMSVSLGNTGTAGYTGSFSASDSKMTISLSGNGTFTSQSRNYCTYQPGKSLLFKGSCVIDSGNNSAGVKSRVGYFDSLNGLYFEYDSAIGMSICYKNNNSVTSIVQTSWNIDPMNGNGTSGINLDFTTAQLFIIDLEWLGVGRIRYGFYIYGKIYYCHEVINVNILTSPYVTSINLPITYSISGSNVGATGSMKQICSTVISEGGYNPSGYPFSINSLSVSISGTSVETIILMLRGGGSNYYHQPILPYSISIVDTNNNNTSLCKIRMYRDGNLPLASAITWNNVDSNSVAQYSTSTGSLVTTNSTVLYETIFSGKGSVDFGSLTNTFTSNVTQITSNVNNVSDILVITSTMLSGSNSTIYASMNWYEYY